MGWLPIYPQELGLQIQIQTSSLPKRMVAFLLAHPKQSRFHMARKGMCKNEFVFCFFFIFLFFRVMGVVLGRVGEEFCDRA